MNEPGAGPSCGPDRDQDCCARASVPAGRFIRSHDAINCENPSLVASVGGFDLDVYEVSVGRFRAFLAAGQGIRTAAPKPGAGAHPSHPGSGWDPAWNIALTESRVELDRELDCGPGATWTAEPGANETQPINCASFYEALAFCAWDGGFLPTEAERNYVASGGAEQRVFPWSSPPESMHISPEHAVHGSAGTAPVGTHRAGDGRWGHADLAGNVWEWTIDEVELAKVLPTEGAEFCEPAGMPVPCEDCLATDAGTARVLRGGGWGLPERGMAVAIRRGGEPDERHHVFGIRCARPSTGGSRSAACTPACGEGQCGDDGCGGSCGECPTPAKLEAASDAGVTPRPLANTDLAQPEPIGLGVGVSIAALRLSAIGPEGMQPLALADYATPDTAGVLAVYITTGWAAPDRSAELIAWASADPARALVIVMVEGDRRGQPADVGNLQQFVQSRGLTVATAMDTHGQLDQALGAEPSPRLLLVDRATMTVLSSTDPSSTVGVDGVVGER